MTDVAATPDKPRDAAPDATDSQGMGFLVTRQRKLVTVYLPLAIFVFVLLFPFYWMTVTTFKPNDELFNFRDHNPFWIGSPTLANVEKLLFQTQYPEWLLNTMVIAVSATFVSIFASVLAAYGALARSRLAKNN